jgi:glyoxylase-like metal-dependent hydrolase (beta-lactamase superfamily II)
LAALKRATGAAIYMHPLDAPIALAGGGFRPMTPAPGPMANLMFRLFVRPPGPIEGATTDQLVNDGDVLPIAGGLAAIHTPGHCAGHLAFLWPKEGLLFAGDTCSNLPRLGLSIVYEDLQVGKQSLIRLAKLDFEVACFGHGKAIQRNASKQFRKHWY